MLILSLWNYLRGYVIIILEGLYLEKIINMCILNDIYLWDIKRLNHTSIEAKINIKGFRALCKIVRRSGSRIYISEKNGCPFWMNKVKRRKMLLFGAFFSLILLIALSSFIFIIEITGTENIAQEVIMEALEESGLRWGANKYFIDVNDIENNLLTKIHQLAWVGIELRGIRARIEIVEKTEPPEIIDKSSPCHVAAAKYGVIEKVIVRNGDALVKQGDIVTPGDILITGIVERENAEEQMLVHAYGEVYARTYYEKNKSIKLLQIKKEKTGNKFGRITVRIGSFTFTIGQKDNPFNLYTNEEIFQWKNLKFPIEITKEEFYETVTTRKKLDINEAKQLIHKEAVEKLMEQIPQEGEILYSRTSFKIEENVLYGSTIIEVLENIAVKKKLLIEED